MKKIILALQAVFIVTVLIVQVPGDLATGKDVDILNGIPLIQSPN